MSELENRTTDLQSEPELDNDSDPPPTTRRPTWISDALLPKTSPIVPWNNETLRETRRLNENLEAVRADRAIRAASLERLEKEMENAWQSYVQFPIR